MMILFCVSIAILLSLLTFNPNDPGWGVVSVQESHNILGEVGSWVSSLIIREFGLIPGLVVSFVLFVWSLKLFNKSTINYFKLKALSLFLFIVLGSLSDAYLELLVTNYLNFQNSHSSKKDILIGFLLFFLKIYLVYWKLLPNGSLILGISSTIFSLVLFFWISSLGPAEKQFFKFIAGHY